MHTFLSAAKRFIKDEAGVTAIEYGLIAALIAVVVAAGFKLVGNQLNITLSSLVNALTS